MYVCVPMIMINFKEGLGCYLYTKWRDWKSPIKNRGRAGTQAQYLMYFYWPDIQCIFTCLQLHSNENLLIRESTSVCIIPTVVLGLYVLSLSLRFLCSRSGRVYLHTDIRLIFARRAPDTDPDASKVSLFTVVEGPSNPKYGPLDQPKKS